MFLFCLICLSCCWYFMFLVGWLCFPVLEQWSSVGDILLSQPCVPLSSPKLCALVAPAVRVLLLCSANCGLSGRLGWLLVRLVAKPCPVQRVLALVGRTRSRVADCRTPGGPGLMLAYWWVIRV